MTHEHEYRLTERRSLVLSLSITFSMMAVEFVGGYLTNSLALISDAGHMLTHSFALILGLAAIYLANKPPCSHKTFGLYRAEILAAFVNGIFLIVVAAIIIYEAVLRIVNPAEVFGMEMLIIAIAGLGVNSRAYSYCAEATSPI